MKRRFLKLVVFCLLGAIVDVAVASWRIKRAHVATVTRFTRIGVSTL